MSIEIVWIAGALTILAVLGLRTRSRGVRGAVIGGFGLLAVIVTLGFAVDSWWHQTTSDLRDSLLVAPGDLAAIPVAHLAYPGATPTQPVLVAPSGAVETAVATTWTSNKPPDVAVGWYARNLPSAWQYTSTCNEPGETIFSWSSGNVTWTNASGGSNTQFTITEHLSVVVPGIVSPDAVPAVNSHTTAPAVGITEPPSPPSFDATPTLPPMPSAACLADPDVPTVPAPAAGQYVIVLTAGPAHVFGVW